MTKLTGHFRANAIAYLALFVALGGTSYAAITIPPNSVGTRQLRNGAVTPAKVNGRAGVPYVGFWAWVDSSGRVRASSKPATTSGWGTVQSLITFRGVLPSDCFPLASVTESPTTAAVGYVAQIASGSTDGKTTNLLVTMNGPNGMLTPLSLYVTDLCP